MKWESRVRSDIQAARNKPHPIIIDTLPRFLDQLIEALSPESDRNTAPEGSTACQEHGGERARVTNYSIEEVIHEYQVLRVVLLEVLDSSAPLSEDERTIIVKSIDEAMKQSALSFSLTQSALREQFFATLSHDIRTPLTTARANVQMILKYPNNMAQHIRYAERTVRQLERIDKMITDLLNTNRVSAGKQLSLRFDQCDLVPIIRDLVEEQSVIQAHRFKLELPPAAFGYWNAEALQRAIENLEANAVKYGDPHSPITIQVQQIHERTLISIHNRGNPIPPEEQESLFQAYKRTVSSESGQAKGWGLGLAWVRAVAEAHGGSVMVDSSPERGTYFALDIPTDARPFQEGAARQPFPPNVAMTG
jgi:signal transduction histidine kinase